MPGWRFTASTPADTRRAVICLSSVSKKAAPDQAMGPGHGDAEARAAMPAGEAHAGRRARPVLDGGLHLAVVIGTRGVDQPQGGGEAVRPERAAEAEVGRRDFPSGILIRPVPHLMVEPPDKV